MRSRNFIVWAICRLLLFATTATHASESICTTVVDTLHYGGIFCVLLWCFLCTVVVFFEMGYYAWVIMLDVVMFLRTVVDKHYFGWFLCLMWWVLWFFLAWSICFSYDLVPTTVCKNYHHIQHNNPLKFVPKREICFMMCWKLSIFFNCVMVEDFIDNPKIRDFDHQRKLFW